MVAVRYVVAPNGEVGFAFGSYDRAQPLTIDPTLTYSTYLGGSGDDYAYGIAVDSVGNIYVTGKTNSSNFPVLGAPQGSLSGGYDAFITKLNPAGTALVYSTYIGGSADDIGRNIAVDSTGAAYITGWTLSTNFPTASAYQASCSGTCTSDAFVTKLNQAGSALSYSTYLGGTGADYGYDIEVDFASKVYIVGATASSNFPTSGSLQSYSGAADAFVTKLDPTNLPFMQLIYSTYLGGSGADAAYALTGDFGGLAGNVYITGYTASSNFPVTSPTYDSTANGSNDVFVTQLNWSGSALSRIFSTYLGGSGDDVGVAIALDGAGAVYLTGWAGSTNFPVAGSPNLPLRSTKTGGTYDAFVSKLNPITRQLVYGAYLGGSSDDIGYGIALDSSNNAYVVGSTFSSNFPNACLLDVVILCPPSGLPAGGNVFVTEVNAAGSDAIYNHYLGSGGTRGYAIAVDSAGAAYITGVISATTLNPLNPIQTYGGASDGFVAKISGSTTPPATRTIQYTYDGLLRLTIADETPGPGYTYAYDLAGNRTDVKNNGIPIEPHRTYDAANQVVGFTYDNAGNLTNDGTTVYTYDALSRVTQVNRVGVAPRSSTYNGDGVLVKQVVSLTTYYAQDLAAPLSQVLRISAGSTTTDYLYGATRLASVSGATRTWELGDALLSVRRTMSDAGALVGSVNYDPWGSVESGTVSTFGFTGELQDTTTGLVNLRARWYSTARGTFTSVDTFAGFPEQPSSLHPYAYALSNPVLYTDPTGRCSRQGDDYCFPNQRRSGDPILTWAQFQAIYFPDDPSMAHNPPQIRNAGRLITPSEAADFAEAYLTYVSNPAAYPPAVRSRTSIQASIFAEYFLHISLEDVAVGMALENVQSIFAQAKAQGRGLTSQEATCVMRNGLALGFAYWGLEAGMGFLGGGFRGFFGSSASRARAYDVEFNSRSGSAGGGSRTIRWSSPQIARAAEALENGSSLNVRVSTRAEAEEIFVRLFHGGTNQTDAPLARPGPRYRNATGLKGEEAEAHFGRQGWYQWQETLDNKGRLQGHEKGNTDGQYRHLQIWTWKGDIGNGKTVRIFFGTELPWQ
jgi:RHS repeat-associated protein